MFLSSLLVLGAAHAADPFADTLYAALGKDGMRVDRAHVDALLVDGCAAGEALLCSPKWWEDGRVEIPTLASAARAACTEDGSSACLALGMALTRGPTVGLAPWTATYGEGIAVLSRSCSAGRQRACTESAVARMYADPARVPPETAADLHAACVAGDAPACFAWAVGEQDARWSESNLPGALEALTRACASGYAPACGRLAVSRTPDRAGIDWATVETACVAGLGTACERLAHRPGTAPERTDELLDIACAARDWSACAGLGERLVERSDPAADPLGGWDLLSTACMHGAGCQNLPTLAATLVSTMTAKKAEQACAAGKGSACSILAIAEGGADHHNWSVQRTRLQTACEQDDPAACLELSWYRLGGLGGPGDAPGAMGTLDEWCSLGGAAACRRELGWLRSERITGLPADAQLKIGQASCAGSGKPGCGAHPAAPGDPPVWQAVNDATPSASGAGEDGSVAWAEIEVRKRVAPTYPDAAKERNIREEVCVVRLSIGTQGEVTDVATFNCDPIFRSSALAATRQWSFYPYKDPDGNVVPALFDLTINFRLK